MKISVVIPCHNGEAYLAAAIASVLRQSLLPSEIVVVDDGSTDASLSVARSFGEPVRAISGRFGGASAARLAGLRETKAEADAYLFLDADDLLGRGALAGLAEALPPGGIAACTWHRYRRENGAWHVEPASCPPLARRDSPLQGWLRGWYHPPCSVLWSRGAYETSGGWDAGVSVNDDGDLMMRALIEGAPLHFAGRGEAFYRRQPDGQSLSGQQHTAEGLRSRLDVLIRVGKRLRKRGLYPVNAAAYTDALRLLHNDALAADDIRKDVDRVLSDPATLDGMPEKSIAAAIPQVMESTPSAIPRKNPAPAVSVVIPTYNRPESTVRAVNSVLAQDFSDFEILVVDDASSDGTADAVAALPDERIRLLRQTSNRGVAAARNRGMAEARGAYLSFLDSDDQWMPGKLSAQMRAVRDAPTGTGMVHVLARNIAGEDAPLPPPPPPSGNLWRILLTTNVLHGAPSGILLRREVFDTVGGFDEALPAIEDWDFWIRASRFFDTRVIGEAHVLYDDSGDDARRSRALTANIRARLDLFERHRAALLGEGIWRHHLHETAGRLIRGRKAWKPEELALLARIALLHKEPLRHILAGTKKGGGERARRRKAGTGDAGRVPNG